MTDQMLHCLPDSDKRLSLQLSELTAPREDNCTRAPSSLGSSAPCHCSHLKCVSLINAADSRITISRNFWLPMADARCQILKISSYHLSLLLWLPQTWMETSPSSEQKLSQESDGHTPPASCHLSKTSSKTQQHLCNNLIALVKVHVSHALVLILFQKPPANVTKSRPVVQKFQPLRQPVSFRLPLFQKPFKLL